MNYVVIGGGISGLVAAWRLLDLAPDSKITVIERAPKFGGLLAGRRYADEQLYFDLGTHIFQETGLKALDDFFYECIGAASLVTFPHGKGDLAGLYFNGALQTHTHFPDIRQHPDTSLLTTDVRTHVSELVGAPTIDRAAPLADVAESVFGRAYAQRVILPLLANVYRLPAQDLAGFAMLLPGLTRVILDDEDVWHANKDQERYRSVVGYPDQELLPQEFRHNRRSFYSSQYGSSALIDGAVAWLARSGVRMVCGANVVKLDASSCSLAFQTNDSKYIEVAADGVVFAAGPVSAAQLLGIKLEQFSFDRPLAHGIVNLQMHETPTSRLCYAYGLDVACEWYRVTNYRGFSGDPMDRRLTVEVLGDRFSNTSDIEASLLPQLRHCGLIGDLRFDFCDFHRLSAGFPSPTTRNLSALARLSDYLSNSLPRNFVVGGAGVRPEVFFQNEVVLDIYNRVGALT